MPTCTPIYGLAYIACSDRPCDQSTTWCDFTATLESNLDRIDAIVDRTVDTVPQAQVRLTIPRTQGTNPGGGTPQLVPFDTVDVDTDNMVNLAADPFTILLPMQGIYFVYFNVEATTTGAGNALTARAASANGSGAPGVANQFYLDDGSPVFMSSAGEFRYQSPVPAGTTAYTTSDPRLVLQVHAAAVGIPLTAVTFGAYWLRDLP